MKKLAIVVTHPIQYYIPFFKLLAKSCNLKVFYTWGAEGAKEKYDPTFKKQILWDLPLLEGYDYQFLENTAKNAGSHHYKGIVNPSLIEQLNEFKPNAILVYGWAYQSHLKVLRHFKQRIPIWFRGDSTLIDTRNGIKKISRKLLLTWVYSHVDKAFYVGKANKKYFQEFGMRQDQLVFAPHAVDNNRFAEDRKTEAAQLRAKFNIKKEDILILFAGKFEAKKNPLLLLDAFIEINRLRVASYELRDRALDSTSLTHNSQPKMHLLFVGNGELEERLKLMVERLKEVGSRKSEVGHFQKTNIHFLDFQNQKQMPTIYQACDLFCLPSSGPVETWGLAVNEAMACGKAILVSDRVGCGADLVEHGKNGHIFKSKNEGDLISYLSEMCADKDLLREMGKASSTKIVSWTFQHQVESFKTELSKL